MEYFDTILPRFRLVLPEEYPDQGPGTVRSVQPTSTDRSVQLHCSSCVVTVVTDLYFTSDVFHPMVGASEMNSQEIGSRVIKKVGQDS